MRAIYDEAFPEAKSVIADNADGDQGSPTAVGVSGPALSVPRPWSKRASCFDGAA